jgi:polysaccharide export outer membrane protein
MIRLLALLATALFISGPAYAQSRGHTLQPGDGIRLRVFGAADPSLTGEFVVDERLIVVLPKIGEWSVAGIPADSIRPRVVRALSDFVLLPGIEATPYRRIAITGEVAKPGLYPIDASLSIGEAIILAGGLRPDARENVVELRRMGQRRGTRTPMEARVWEVSIAPGEQLVVPRLPWIRREGIRSLTTTISVIGSITILVARLGF